MMRSRRSRGLRSKRSFSEIILSSDGMVEMAPRRDPVEAPAPAARVPGIVPRAESLFEPVRDRNGWRLALVFGNHAPGGLCPYAVANRCFHCDIGLGEGAAFDHVTNRERLGFFRDHYQSFLGLINHL